MEQEGKLTSLVVVTLQKEHGIKEYFSRRGIVYGGILISENNEESLKFLLKHLNNFYRNQLIYIEIRNNFDYSIFKSAFQLNNFNYQPHFNVQLKTENTSMEAILSNMKYNRRREINISFKEGAEVNEAQNENEVIALFDILKDLYTTKVKLPLPNLNYFIGLYKSKIGKVFIVKHHNKVIGGSFCIFHQGMSINTLYYAGIRNYHKKIFPTHLAIMGVTEFAIRNNLKMVDFMGAGKPGKEYGVRDYKLEFGGELLEHGRYLKIINPILYNIGKLGLKLLAKIK
ncbi:MAG: GNAT family N-acetyltransferase [Bacteroidetes bacterium]|nr:GNAT family N-acetyltransferase [Bacteroidota bacterium]